MGLDLLGAAFLLGIGGFGEVVVALIAGPLRPF